MKGKDLHPSLVYPAKVSFRMEGQIKCFPDKVKLKEFIITKPLLYEMLKVLQNRPGGWVGGWTMIYYDQMDPPLCSGGAPPSVLGLPCPLPGKDICQCQRLVKRKRIIYLKSYTNLRVMT